MAYKVFSNGSVLNASEINDNLMNQSVMVFSNSATRDAALPTPLAGMITYLEDKSIFQLYVGTGWSNFAANELNTFIGDGALLDLTTGVNNHAFGEDSLGNLTEGNNNIGIGRSAVGAITTASSNIGIGELALYQQTAGNGNVAIGNRAGDVVTTGATNTLIGFDVAGTLTTGSNNTVLGNAATTAAATTSNSVTLGNSSITSLRCNTTTISSLSDERDKTDIADTQFGLNLIQELRPVDFTWARRDGSFEGMVDIGFISQELAAVEDSLDATDRLRLTLRDNPDSLEATPGRLIPVIVKALQELSAENASLKARLEALEK